MRPALVALVLAACTHTVAVRSAADPSCVEVCKRYDPDHFVACARLCRGAVISDAECTPNEHDCGSSQELTTFGRVVTGIGAGVGYAGAIVLSALLVYWFVTAV